MFENISPAPADTILGLTEAFEKDSNPAKINLGAGVYQDDEGQTPILKSVKAAEAIILERANTKSYLPISGLPDYDHLVQQLLFGEGNAVIGSGRANTVHTPGGTGALRVGADFLKAFLPDAKVWISDPTWPNHRGIFEAAGFAVGEYPYYDATTKALDFESLRDRLARIAEGDVVVLHVCCHNPTGFDPTPEQWKEISAIARERKWIPFLDFAYQGFGSGLDEDRRAVQHLLDGVTEFLIANSFSKNFALYQDRTGSLTMVGASTNAGDAALSQIKRIIRVNYSNPPAHGGHIVRTILKDPALRAEWEGELKQMRDRVKSMRSALVDGLQKRDVSQDFSFISLQNGIFSFSGLADEQVKFLRVEKSIYMVKGGRINVAGITTKNIDYLCDSIAEALKQ
ncbi:MAG: amino acid aminotransferase [Acidiferrobacterales bacterium]